MKKIIHLTTYIAILFTLVACQSYGIDDAMHDDDHDDIKVSTTESSQTVFFNKLKDLCGQKFVGQSTFPADPRSRNSYSFCSGRK